MLKGMARKNKDSLGNPDSPRATVQQCYDALVDALHACKFGKEPGDPAVEPLTPSERKTLKHVIANWWGSGRFGKGTMHRGVNATYSQSGTKRSPNSKAAMLRGGKKAKVATPRSMEFETPTGGGETAGAAADAEGANADEIE